MVLTQNNGKKKLPSGNLTVRPWQESGMEDEWNH